MEMYKSPEFNNVNTMSEGQIKKHVSQLNRKELEMVNKAIKHFNLDKMIISPHLQEKMEVQGISFNLERIKKVIRNFKIEKNLIEVNYNLDKSLRVCIKDDLPVEVNVNGEVNKCVICFVINFSNGHLCTVYWNKIKHSKRIPNLNRYCRNYDMVQHLRKYI